MQVDRYIIDFLQWLHDLLWLRKQKKVRTVVTKIGSPVRTPYGYIQQIRRHLPPEVPDRDVSAWIFMPLRGDVKKSDVKDYYIVCLFLGPVATGVPAIAQKTPVKRRRATSPTHRIIVVQASRWLNNWEGFESNFIFCGDFDLQGHSEFPHRNAKHITRELVMTLRRWPIEAIDWKAEIEILRKITSLSGP
ncbi:MAG: hypothetical protein SNJ57_10050 [Cyanobacteriota bacterium]